ncbi:hypothetical protein [Pseudoduganella sp.]|uniref:hypothetical protein n=1 Tax=Pseudoduganella sp. TaxID=1880898 RepID=UPI0035B2A677
MPTIRTAVRPQALLAALVQFLQDIHRPRVARATAGAAHELSLLQLYRLSRGRESIAPGVNRMLARRFER